METKSAILCTTWVKRGVAAAVPDKVRFSKIFILSQLQKQLNKNL